MISNKQQLSARNQQESMADKGLISKVTLFVTILFIFLMPWGDGLWDGTPRIAATISLGLSAILFLTQGTHKNYSFYHFFLVFYMAWQMLSLTWTSDLPYALPIAKTTIQLLFLAIMFTIVIDTKAKIQYAYQAYVIGNVVGSFIIIYNYIHDIQSFYYGRYGITNIETDTLSVILAVSIPMAAYLASKPSNIILKLINLFAIPIVFYSIFLTGSRTGSIAGALGVFYWIFTYRKSSITTKGLIAVLMISSVVGIAAFSPKFLVDRVFSSGQSIQSGTLNSRTMIWGGALEQWRDVPLQGTGIGGLGDALSKLHIKYRDAHNTYIHILSENGLVGLLFYLLIIISLFYYIIHTPFEESAFLLTLLLTILVSQLATHTQTEKFLWFAFTMIAIHAQKYSNSQQS